MKALKSLDNNSLLKHHNVIAAVSSIVPGLGHLYKGHVKEGVGIFFVSLMFIWIGLILALATGGVGLLAPVLYLVGVGWHAYVIEDERDHPINSL